MDLVNIIKVLGDENRLRILNILKHGELCVCEIEKILDINQSNTSRHLNKLTTARLIGFQKKALYVYYYINTKTLEEYKFLNELISNEINKLEKCKADVDKLRTYRSSGLSCDDLKDGKVCFGAKQ